MFNHLCPILVQFAENLFGIPFSLTLHQNHFCYEYRLVPWSCTSCWQDPRWLKTYYRPQVPHAFKVNLAHVITFLFMEKPFNIPRYSYTVVESLHRFVFMLCSLVHLANRILNYSENTTSQRAAYVCELGLKLFTLLCVK